MLLGNARTLRGFQRVVREPPKLPIKRAFTSRFRLVKIVKRAQVQINVLAPFWGANVLPFGERVGEQSGTCGDQLCFVDRVFLVGGRIAIDCKNPETLQLIAMRRT
jgi:hypothetical protein